MNLTQMAMHTTEEPIDLITADGPTRDISNKTSSTALLTADKGIDDVAFEIGPA